MELKFKLNKPRLSQKNSNNPLPKNVLHRSFTVLNNFIDKSGVYLVILTIVFALSNIFSKVNSDISVNAITFLFTLITVLLVIKIIKFVLNPKNNQIEIFSFDTTLMLFVSTYTSISLLPFIIKQIGIQIPSINVGSSFNLEVFSSINLIISLFFIYFAVNELKKLKKFSTIILTVPLLLFVSLLFGFGHGAEDVAILSLCLLVITNITVFIASNLKSKTTFLPAVIITSLIGFRYLGLIPSLATLDFLSGFVLLLPILILVLITNKNVFVRSNLFLLIGIIIWALLPSIVLLEFLASIFISSILVLATIFFLHRKFFTSRFKKIIHALFTKPSENILDKVDLTILMFFMFILFGMFFYSYDLIFSSGLVISQTFNSVLVDIAKALLASVPLFNWLVGLNFINLNETLITLVFSKYGLVGVFGFVSLIILVVSKLIRTPNIHESHNNWVVSRILMAFNVLLIFTFGILNKWSYASYFIFWLIIALSSLLIDLNLKKNVDSNTEILFIESKNKSLNMFLEIGRMLFILIVIYLGYNMVINFISMVK